MDKEAQKKVADDMDAFLKADGGLLMYVVLSFFLIVTKQEAAREQKTKAGYLI